MMFVEHSCLKSLILLCICNTLPDNHQVTLNSSKSKEKAEREKTSDALVGRVRFREHSTFYSFLMADKNGRW